MRNENETFSEKTLQQLKQIHVSACGVCLLPFNNIGSTSIFLDILINSRVLLAVLTVYRVIIPSQGKCLKFKFLYHTL